MRDITDKQDNTAGATGELTAAEYNDHKNELQNFVESTGQTLDINKTPDQLGRSGFIYGTAAQTMQDAAPSANVIELTPVTGASGLIVPDAYSTMDGLIVEFDKGTANTSTTVTINFGQTSITLLGAKSLKTKLGLDPGIGTVTGRCRIQFDVSNDWWILLNSDFVVSEDVIGSLYVDGTPDVILEESILFGTSISQQNLGGIGSLAASAWYFVVIREDTLAVSLQSLSALTPTTPAGWSPTLASNQLDLLPFYDNSVNYPRYVVGGNTYRILWVFKTDATPSDIISSVKTKNKLYSYVKMFNSAAQATITTLAYVTFSDIEIDLLSEVSGTSTSRVFTAKQSNLLNYHFDTAETSIQESPSIRLYVNTVLYKEQRTNNGTVETQRRNFAWPLKLEANKNMTLELKAQRTGAGTFTLNLDATVKGTELSIYGFDL